MQANRDQQKTLVKVMLAMLRATDKCIMKPAFTNSTLKEAVNLWSPWSVGLCSSVIMIRSSTAQYINC